MQSSPPLSFRQFHIFQILKQWEIERAPLDRFLNLYFRTHTAIGSKDRKFISDNIYEMIRWRLLLDQLSGERPTIETHYAILQAFQPSQFLSVHSIAPHIRVSFPKELFCLLKETYGEEHAFYLCQVSNTKAPLCIRVNPNKTTREKLIKTLEGSHAVYPTKNSALGIQFKERTTLLQLPEYKEGFFEIQDEASQLISDLVPVLPGNQVLDYCAGSGGKSLGFAYKMKGEGTIYLHDTRPYILLEAKKRVQRAGLTNVQYIPAKDPQLQKLKKQIDCLLLDVPCSGTGTIRRNPDQKWRFSLEMLQNLVLTQRKIFAEAYHYVKPGGTIVYATCSLLKEENEEQMAYFLKHFPLTLKGKPFSSQPSFEGMDGFFAVSFQINY